MAADDHTNGRLSNGCSCEANKKGLAKKSSGDAAKMFIKG